MFIDTHCHLTGEFVEPIDISAVVARAHDANVGALICATADSNDHAAAIQICQDYQNIFCTIGVHPESAERNPVLEYESILSNPKVVGIGEIGLDYHYGIAFKDKQIESFRAQLNIAKRTRLPVAIHTRDAEDDTATILCSPEFADVGGVMHCYTSNWELAKKMLDRGFFFSASGIITFKNSEDVRDVFRRIPIDMTVIETDSPFCAPIPYRGKTAEPYMVPMVAKMLSEIHSIPLPEIENILMQNTMRLYPKIKL